MASASAGIGSALPSQVGNSGLYLTTDGTVATWATVSGGGGVTTLAAVGSSPNANGGTIASTTLTLQPADATHPGLVTSGTQTLGGVKTIGGCILNPTLSFSGPGISFGATAFVGTNAAAGVVIGTTAVDTVGLYVNGAFRMLVSATSADMTGLGNGGSIQLKSANGTTFTLTVSNAGALVIT